MGVSSWICPIFELDCLNHRNSSNCQYDKGNLQAQEFDLSIDDYRRKISMVYRPR